MPRNPKPPPDDPEQSKRFVEIAREVGAEGTKEDFDRAFKRVASGSKAKTKMARPQKETSKSS